MTDNEMEIIKKMIGGIPYTFQRANGFYPLILQSDEEAEANGFCNPGTICITNEIDAEGGLP